jgi:hypothetical protein
MFRNSLNLTLNPESIFLLQNGPALAGISPLGATLSATRQWSLYFRLSKQLRWGAGLPTESPDRLNTPSGGAGGDSGRRGAGEGAGRRAERPGVSREPGRLADRESAARMDAMFSTACPRARTTWRCRLAELPADFDPGDAQKARVVVQPRRTARADFEVLPLMACRRQGNGPVGAPLEGIVIRMLPPAAATPPPARTEALSSTMSARAISPWRWTPAHCPRAARLTSPPERLRRDARRDPAAADRVQLHYPFHGQNRPQGAGNPGEVAAGQGRPARSRGSPTKTIKEPGRWDAWVGTTRSRRRWANEWWS